MGKGRPQQPELARSERTPAVQNSREQQAGDAEPPPAIGKAARRGPPPANRPGHHPQKDQDKPTSLGGAGHGTGRPGPRG